MRNTQDFIGGGASILIGLFAIFYAATNLVIGTMRNMGPGMLPLSMGVALVGLGVALLACSFLKARELPPVNLRALVIVSLAVLVFPLVLPVAGLLPAVAATVLVVTRLSPETGFGQALLIAAVLGSVVTLIFRVGLSLHIPLLVWPFG